jgi:1,6-anhydro-N-acetylmuramate kinase
MVAAASKPTIAQLVLSSALDIADQQDHTHLTALPEERAAREADWVAGGGGAPVNAPVYD